jgi:MFS family permease
MLVVGTLNFVLSMFFRVSTAVVSPALVNDLGFTSAQLSDLSASLFYAFALSQIPVGVALDRVGPRVTLGILAVFAVGGAVLFAVGRTPAELIAARVLLGIGIAGNLMVVLALLAVWFPVDRFAFLSGLVVSVGTLGNLLAATPLTLLILRIGWRESFVLFAAIDALIVGAFLIVMRDRPPGYEASVRKSQPLTAHLRELLRMYAYWAISATNFVRYGYFAALQSLWIAPFLIYGIGLGEIDAGNALFSLSLGYMVALPLWGSLSDRVFRSRKGVVLWTMLVCSLLTLSLSWLDRGEAVWIVLLIFFWIGFAAAPGQISYAHIKELLPESMIAQAMTAVNLFTVLGAGFMTHLLGMVIGPDPSGLAGPAAFRWIWYVGALGLGISCALYAFVPDSKVLKVKES